MPVLPLVSVVIPVYNGSSLIHEAVESILAQTYRVFEVIVVDDGSEDGEDLARTLAPYREIVRLVRQSHSGIAAALNRGLAEMRGSYFSWLSHDDLYFPEKLEAEIRSHATFGRDVVLYSDYCYIDPNGQVLSVRRIPAHGHPPVRPLLLQNDWIHGCAMLIPRQAIESVGGFDEHLRTTQDYDLFFRLSKQFEFRHIPHVLAAVRLHGQQTTQKLKDHVLSEQDDLYSRCISEVPASEIETLPPHNVAGFYRYLYRKYTIGLLKKAARVALDKAWNAAGSPLEYMKVAMDVAIANPLTLPVLRPVVQRRAALSAVRSKLDAPLRAPGTVSGRRA